MHTHVLRRVRSSQSFKCALSVVRLKWCAQKQKHVLFSIWSSHCLKGKSKPLIECIHAISACNPSIITKHFCVPQCLCFCVHDSNAWRRNKDKTSFWLEQTFFLLQNSRWIEHRKSSHAWPSRELRNHYARENARSFLHVMTSWQLFFHTWFRPVVFRL